MDSYREHPSDFEVTPSSDAAATQDVAAAIGTDERRMHVRAYNHWVSLLDGRDFPSIEDLEPANVSDFAGNSILLDFTCSRDDPAIVVRNTSVRLRGTRSRPGTYPIRKSRPGGKEDGAGSAVGRAGRRARRLQP